MLQGAVGEEEIPAKLGNLKDPWTSNLRHTGDGDPDENDFESALFPREEENADEAPAWSDPDPDSTKVDLESLALRRKLRTSLDEKLLSVGMYEERLRKQRQAMSSQVNWSQLEQMKEYKTVPMSLKSASERLEPGKIELSRLKDANQSETSNSVVGSVEFHPSSPLLLTAGLDRHLRFFNVDGVENTRVQSIFIKDMPIHQASFADGGSKVVASGRRPFFYVLDLETAKIEREAKLFGRQERSIEAFATSPSSKTVAFFGRDGNIPLVSMLSRQVIGNIKMNGSVRAGTFLADGHKLLTSGQDGIIYLWDLRKYQCIDRFIDEGNVGSAALAASSDPYTFASGSTVGIVNVYRIPETSGRGASQEGLSKPTIPQQLRPLKALNHLVTSADIVRFSPDGQILAIASRLTRDAFKLIHVRSLTAFSNWPTSRTPLHYVHSACFSPKGGYLAIGNARGRVLLYRLSQYPETC